MLGRPGPLTAGHHFPSGYPRCAGGSPARPPAGIFSANVNSNRLPSLLGVGVAEGMLIARGLASPWLFNASPSLSLREERRHPRGFCKVGGPLLAQLFCEGRGINPPPPKSWGHTPPLGFLARRPPAAQRLESGGWERSGARCLFTRGQPGSAEHEAALPGSAAPAAMKRPMATSRSGDGSAQLGGEGGLRSRLELRVSKPRIEEARCSPGRCLAPFWGLSQPPCQPLVLLSLGIC